MMDWTDRHCRYFLRLFSPRVLLYTEMIVAKAILRGDPERLLAHDPAEHPVALQLGGSDPAELASAAAIGAEFGFDEINLNVGCPSDRAQSATFGACLMARPALVADCVSAMREAQRRGAARRRPRLPFQPPPQIGPAAPQRCAPWPRGRRREACARSTRRRVHRES
jgi:tRNA dihydrouridine synthase A